MAENTRMKDMQANVKRMIEVLMNHSTQFLKVSQTFEALQTLFQGHNDRFVKVEQALDSILSLLHQSGDATTSQSLCSDGSNSQSNVASRQLFSVLQPQPHMTVDIPIFSTDDVIQWLYSVSFWYTPFLTIKRFL